MTTKDKILHKTLHEVLKFIYKDPLPNIKRGLHMAKHVVGHEFPANTWTKAEEFLVDDDNIWRNYALDLLKDLNPDVLEHMLQVFTIDMAYEATNTVRRNREIYKCNIPWAILLDPTSACNLKCVGCWAAEYGYKNSLTLNEMLRIVAQAKELGTHFFIFTGGEPLMRKDDIIKIARINPDCAFLAFTNGTLVDEKFCDDLVDVGNVTLAISNEGTEETNDARRGKGVYQKTMRAMKLLKEHGLLFGVSVCYTSANYKAVTDDAYYDKMIAAGAKYMWFFHYMPVGGNASTDLLLTPEQREYVYHKIRKNRSKTGKPIFVLDFQNDGEFVGGCIAGGRNYFHINSRGDAEPCVFIHYSDSNIREKTILECLQSPMFREYYHGQPFNDNMLRPCPMLENPQALRKMVKRAGAKSTNFLEPETAEQLCAKCDKYAADWAPTAEKLWNEGYHHQSRTRYYRDSPEGKTKYKKEDF